jgi:hypothetical protein
VAEPPVKLGDQMMEYDFGFWPSAGQSIKNLSPKTGSVESGFLKFPDIPVRKR